MAIAVVRYQVEEKYQETFHVGHDVKTVGDLRKALMSKMGLNPEVSLGFFYPESTLLSDLGVRGDSYVRVSDWVGDLLTSINDPENAFQLPEAEHEKVFSENAQWNAFQLPEAEHEKVFSENAQWFDESSLIKKAEYDNADTQKKILNPQMKIRVLLGHATIASPAAAFAVFPPLPPTNPPTRTKWVYGTDIHVNASATLEELTSALRKEGQLHLPPRFKFLTLGHKELVEDRNLKGNGISDGDVLILCQLQEWHLRVNLPCGSIELDFNPSLNVSELKNILCSNDSDGGKCLSESPSFLITCHGKVLDDSCSLKVQIPEQNRKNLNIQF